MMKNLMLIIFIVFTNIIGASPFETAMGNCSIIINNKLSHNLEYQYLVKKETQRLVEKYGRVEYQEYQIIVPSTKKEFYKLARTAPEWGIAIAKSKENKILIQPSSISNMSKKRFNEIIVHELNHLYIHRLIKNNPMPSWFIEGIAMKFSNEFSFTDKIEISNAIWKNSLLPLDALKNFNTKKQHQIKLAYAQSAAALNALEYYYNDKILDKLIQLLKKEVYFWDAINQITGDDKIDFQKKYEEYLTKYFLWIFLLNASNIMFVLFPFILTLGFYIKRKKNIKILNKWELEEELIEMLKDDIN